MKRKLIKLWGIGLVVVLLSSLFIAATPASAAEPLNWEMKIDSPSGIPGVAHLQPGSDIRDFAFDSSGMIMYAVGYWDTVPMIGITANFTADGTSDNYTVTYIDEDGASSTTTVTIASGANTATAPSPMTLTGGDTGVMDIVSIVASGTNDALAGAFTLTDFGSFTGMGTYTVGAAVAFVDGDDLTRLWQSGFGGGMASEISSRLPAGKLVTLDYVAIAPDDPNVVVVASATPTALNEAIIISDDGGATWNSMGVIQDETVSTNPTGILGVAISPIVTGNYRYVAVYGRNSTDDAAGNGAAIYYYNFGAGVGAWKEARADFVNTPTDGAFLDNIVGMAFSPGFAADYMAVALSEQIGSVAASTNGSLMLHLLSFNSNNWDEDVASDYAVEIANTGTTQELFDVNSADITLHPDYDGGDEALRISFVGASINHLGNEAGDVWRCRDIAQPYPLFGAGSAGINSVAFDGTNLAAGAYESNNVYHSADPLASSPTILPGRSYKKIGVDTTGVNDMVKLIFAGETLYGTKRGAASAISKSVDYGNTWNDYALMDSGSGIFLNAGTVTDIYITAAGDPWYMAANDGGETSIYRIAMFSVQKVLCVPGAVTLMLRGVDDNPDVLYAGVEGGTDIYYTADAGLSRWYKRTAPRPIADMAVESDDVIYIGESGIGTINVYKSITKGFTWSLPIDTKLGAGNSINTLLSLSENELLVAGTAGGLNYTKDGGSTWTKTLGIMFGGPVQPTATGLNTGDFIYLAHENDNAVWRCEIGPANPVGEFLSMGMKDQTAAEKNTGIVLRDGVLYALSAGSSGSYINRTLSPTVPGTHSGGMWGNRYMPETGVGAFNRTPSALKASSGPANNVVLYAIDSGTSFVYYFDDTLALTGPVILGPKDGSMVQMNSITGYPQDVNFNWARASKATKYEVAIALDADFTSVLNVDDAAGTGDGTDPYCEVAGPFNVMSLIVDGRTFQPGTTYYWKVRSDLPLTGAWSESRSFTIQPGAAAVPTIGSPANGSQTADPNPAFSWSPVSGANKYEFQLAVSTNFATPLYSDTIAETGIRPAVKLDPGTTYFWRVRAVDPVVGDWSTIANFTVAVEAPPPPKPVEVITSPPPVIEIPPPEPAPIIEIPAPPPATEPINDAYILAIIIIGAVLVIAVIVLIVRTRRTV